MTAAKDRIFSNIIYLIFSNNIIPRHRLFDCIIGECRRMAYNRNRHWTLRNRKFRRMYEIFIVRIRHAIPNNILTSIRINRRFAYPPAGRARCPQRAACTNVNRILNRARPRHRTTKRRLKRVRVNRMPLAVVDECRVKLRDTSLRHFTVSRLFTAINTAADIRLRNRKLTVYCSNSVVPCLCIIIKRISKYILAIADIRLRTSHIV